MRNRVRRLLERVGEVQYLPSRDLSAPDAPHQRDHDAAINVDAGFAAPSCGICRHASARVGEQGGRIFLLSLFKDGSKTENVEVEYPIGHRRRKEGVPLLEAKYETNLARRFTSKQQAATLDLCRDQKRLEAAPVNEFVDWFAI